MPCAGCTSPHAQQAEEDEHVQSGPGEPEEFDRGRVLVAEKVADQPARDDIEADQH